MRPDLIEFEVALIERQGTPREVKKWLTEARTWSVDHDEALVIQMQRLPRNRDLPVIETRCHDLAGGARAWMDLEMAEAVLSGQMMAAHIARLWPEEKMPVGASEEEDNANWARIEASFATDVSPSAEALRAMRRAKRRIELMARWPLLVVRPERDKDAPPWDWGDVAELPDEPVGLLDMLVNAHLDALGASEKTRGN